MRIVDMHNDGGGESMWGPMLIIVGVVYVLINFRPAKADGIVHKVIFSFLIALCAMIAYRVVDNYGLIPKQLRITVISTIEELYDEGRSKLNELK